MNITRTNLLFILSGMCGVAFVLSGCSANEPSQWTKSSSPWDKPKTSQPVDAPAAETYKADLEMPVEPMSSTTSDVELSYQTEQVESFAPQEPAVATEPELEPMEMEEPASTGASIMDQPANFYTMQLMASVDIDRVMKFAEQNQISTQYIVATERDGVIWHVLLLDIYPDYSSAAAARDEIAPSLKSAPWIRSVGSVQKLVAQ